MSEIRVAIAGIGNCASSLVQGIEYYKNNRHKEVIGLMHPELDGYKLSDIKVVAAFDIDKRKVGQPLNRAIFAKPNNTTVFYTDIPSNGVVVKKGEVLDGAAKHMEEYPEDQAFRVADDDTCNVAEELKNSGADLLINYCPVGSEHAVKFYAQAALDAGVGFVNCVPVFVASDKEWARKFEEKSLPIVGDDIKSQVGATIVHRVLTRLFRSRGVKLDRTYQLNIGGNTDFLNMLAQERLTSKKTSKTEAVQSQLEESLPKDNIHIGPSDYVPWLKDNKVCYIRMEGRKFGDIPISLELRLSVEDSPNSGGSAIDAIRCCKVAKDRGVGGSLTSISSYTMKHPPIQYSDDEARQKVEDFIAGKLER